MSAGPGRVRFHKVNIEISNICNLQCSFCPEVVREKRLMEPELFRRIVREVGPLTEQVTLHLMGEPLVHPRLGELLGECVTAGVPVYLVTNGVLLQRADRPGLLLHPAIRQVCFSLHSFHDNFGDVDPSEYLGRIFAFTEKALVERPELYINFRLWNLDQVRGTGSQNRRMLEAVFDRFARIELEGADVRRRKSHRLKGRLYLHFDTEFTWPSLDLPVTGDHGTCKGLSTHFGILVDGTVVPCCLDKEAAIPLGNIGVEPIERILASPRAQAILSGFKQGRLVEDLCRRCPYIERFSVPGARASTA